MARNTAALTALGSRLGSSVDDFTTASKNILENVLIEYCNDGIKLMRKKIQKIARTHGAATLAQAITNNPIKATSDSISIATISGVDYWKYVNDGVKGVYNKSKAPHSKFQFKNLFVPEKMLESFKQYIAATGSKTMSGKSLIRKNKKNQASIIDIEAKQMAVATKIGGTKPMNFVAEAVNDKRKKELARSVKSAMAAGIKANIKRGLK